MPSLSGSSVDRLSLLVAAVATGVVAAMWLRTRPRWGTALFLVALCLVPVWLGVKLRAYFPPASVAAGLVLLAGLRLSRARPAVADLPVVFLGVVAVTSAVLGLSGLGPVATAVVVWGAAYLAGRHLCARVGSEWMYGAVAVAFTFVAGLAVLEAVTQVNPFVQLRAGNKLFTDWSEIQIRGGRARVEGAFGHSIALGASLAASVPFVLAAPFRLWVRSASVLLILVAVVTTFSRTGMVCAVLALLLSLFYLDVVPPAARLRLAAVVVVAAAALTPLVLTTFSDAGDEASGSAEYRGALLSLVGDVAPLGLSAAAERTPSADTRFGPFRSIDNFVLLSGLTFGALFAVTLLLILAVAAFAVIRRRATPATVALVAQGPALLTVALITQYASVVWFVAGVAVSSQLARKSHRLSVPVPASPRSIRQRPVTRRLVAARERL
jgi:hypothetical protein